VGGGGAVGGRGRGCDGSMGGSGGGAVGLGWQSFGVGGGTGGGGGPYLQAAGPLDSGRDPRLGLASPQELFARGSLRTDGRACGVRTRLNGARSDARREGLTLT